MTTLPAAPAPARRADRPSLPLTPGRGFALLAGVPVAVFLIALTGFQFVGAVGKASFPVTRQLQLTNGRFTLHDDGGDVNLQGMPGRGDFAQLDGTVSYSLIRPQVFFNDGAGNAGIRLGCPLASLANCAFDAHVTLPAGATVTGTTGGGNVTASGLTGAVTLHTSGGDVRATDLTGTVDLASGGGNLTIEQASGTVTMHTDGGDINGAALTDGTLTASTGGGNVSLTFTAPPRSLVVNTSGGDITIIVPDNSFYEVTAHSDGGDVNNGVTAPGTKHPSAGSIRASTGGGNITIKYAS